MSKTRGLTLGKFAPLHKGHQLVIETALREVDEVMAIIYDCPEITDVPLPVRANWLRTQMFSFLNFLYLLKTFGITF